VLARAGFRDHTLFTHLPREQRLAQRVVDLVCAGVQQIFPLEVDARSAENLAEPLGKIERCRAARVILQQIFQFSLKGRIGAAADVGLLQLFERRHQHFGNVAAAVWAEMSRRVWLRNNHIDSESAAATKLRILL
jgi:hypothetical protein